MDRRTPMVAGIAFAVLYAVALVMVPTLPGIDKPGYDIVSHVNEHSGAMRAQALLLAFGSLALVVVFGYARDRLAGPPAYVFTIGSAAVLVQVGIATWFTAGPGAAPRPARFGHRAHRDRRRDHVGADADHRRHHGGRANPVGRQRRPVPAVARDRRGGLRRRATDRDDHRHRPAGKLHLTGRAHEFLSRRAAVHPVLLGARRGVVVGPGARRSARATSTSPPRGRAVDVGAAPRRPSRPASADAARPVRRPASAAASASFIDVRFVSVSEILVAALVVPFGWSVARASVADVASSAPIRRSCDVRGRRFAVDGNGSRSELRIFVTAVSTAVTTDALAAVTSSGPPGRARPPAQPRGPRIAPVPAPRHRRSAPRRPAAVHRPGTPQPS